MPIQLPADQEHTLRNMDDRIAELRRELERAEQAGIDVADLKAALEQADALRQNLLRVYGTTASYRAKS